jgi:hypothetical protein
MSVTPHAAVKQTVGPNGPRCQDRSNPRAHQVFRHVRSRQFGQGGGKRRVLKKRLRRLVRVLAMFQSLSDSSRTSQVWSGTWRNGPCDGHGGKMPGPNSSVNCRNAMLLNRLASIYVKHDDTAGYLGGPFLNLFSSTRSDRQESPAATEI